MNFPSLFALLAAPALAQDRPGTNLVTILIIGVAVLVGFVLIVVLLRFANLWIQSILTHAGVGLLDMVAMSLRKVSPALIVRAKIMAVQAGLTAIETRDLEAHYLAGGNVMKVITALIAADRARISLDFKQAAAIDLAGRDVVDALRTSVNPKVIDCPDPKKGKTEVAAVAKDGIQVLAKARVTVRTNIPRLVGGATEETIIARVGEGIVSAIGSSNSHKEVLENPDRISKAVLTKGLDAGTAFEIVSIDIADVDIGHNIGARLQADQAEADKRVAQAMAEKRRAMAVAAEQENRAEVMSNRAKVVLAEAEVPKAFADALRTGRIGVFDYYRLQNIQADTKMRDSIGGGGPTAPPSPEGKE